MTFPWFKSSVIEAGKIFHTFCFFCLEASLPMKPVSPLCMDHTGLYSSLLNIGEKYVSVGAHCHDTFGGQWTASGLGPYLRWAFCCCCSLCVPRLTGLRTSRDLCLSFPFYLRTLGYRHMLLCWLYKGSGFKLRFLCFYDNCYTH